MAAGGSPWTQLPRDVADFLAALVLSSDDAIYSKDAATRITSWNPGAERLYGYTAEEALGKPLAMLVPPDRSGEEIAILDRILAGETVEHFETRRLRKDGTTVPVSISVSSVHDSQGRIIEAAVIARDVSERLRAEEEAARRQRKEALELNDLVVQGLAVAKMALEAGDHERGLKTLTTTLENARSIVTRLLSRAGPITPGELVREAPAVLDAGGQVPRPSNQG